MKDIVATLILWGFGIFLVVNACALGVFLSRAAQEAYWRRRFDLAIRRKHPEDLQPLIHLIRRSMKEP
jgi:hypothetical protein